MNIEFVRIKRHTVFSIALEHNVLYGTSFVLSLRVDLPKSSPVTLCGDATQIYVGRPHRFAWVGHTLCVGTPHTFRGEATHALGGHSCRITLLFVS